MWCLRAADGSEVRLGLAGDHQKLNAALAVSLASTWEARSGVAAARGLAGAEERAAAVVGGVLPAEYKEGLEKAHWPGRSHVSLLMADALGVPRADSQTAAIESFSHCAGDT